MSFDVQIAHGVEEVGQEQGNQGVWLVTGLGLD
jgi:hypothetical protein